jgi:hypothetical protein
MRIGHSPPSGENRTVVGRWHVLSEGQTIHVTYASTASHRRVISGHSQTTAIGITTTSKLSPAMPLPPSSSPPSSQQSSLYKFYTPLPSSSPASQQPQSRVLQPSTQHNIPASLHPRIHLKRPHPSKQSTAKKPKPLSPVKKTPVAQYIPEVLPVRKCAPQTITRNLVSRTLGQRTSLSQCIMPRAGERADGSDLLIAGEEVL